MSEQTKSETSTAAVKSISIIKVENGYVVAALGKSHIAKDAEEVKQLLGDRLPDILAALEQESKPQNIE